MISTMATGYRTVGYYVDWAIYGRNFKPQDLNASQFTHILFAFVNINPSTGEVVLADPWADTDIHWDQSWDQPGNNLFGIFYQLWKLKQTNRKLKVLLSVGGWTYSQNGNFPNGVDNPQKRDTFARTAVEMVKNFGLDGIDLDWEYPVDSTQAANFVDLLRLCRQYLNALNPRFELSVAAPCGPDNISKLDIPGMDQYLDFWNLMAYDFAGSWSSVSGHDANIYPSPDNPASTPFSFDASLKMYSAVNPKKLVLGMPLYGRGFANTDGPGKPFSGVGQGHWEAGVWDYKDLPLAGSQVFEDERVIGSYCYDPSSRMMVSYDTPNIAMIKAIYIKFKGLGGAMWWETSGDKGGSNSLIQSVINALGGMDNLDQTQNTISYPDSKYDNVRSFK
ncbi:Chitotriosidase-1 [Orbilia brochopaga]|nr:Chitotriosidase-1 [Drechslerella brochopaga]